MQVTKVTQSNLSVRLSTNPLTSRHRHAQRPQGDYLLTWPPSREIDILSPTPQCACTATHIDPYLYVHFFGHY